MGVSPTDRSGAADRSEHRLAPVMLERWPVKRGGYSDPAFGGVGDHRVVTVGWFRLRGRRDRLMAVILLLPMILRLRSRGDLQRSGSYAHSA